MNHFKERSIYSFYIFNNPFSVVWSIIKDSSLTTDIQANHEYYYTLDPIYHSENISYKQGSSFWYYIEELLSVAFEIQSIIESDYFCSISWSCHLSYNHIPPFKCIYYLHPYGDKEALFIAQYIFPFFFFEQTALMIEEKKRQLYYQRIDAFISNREYRKKQTQLIMLKGNFDKAAHIMLNIKQMAELFSTVQNSSNDLTTKDTVIQVTIKTGKLLGYSMYLIITVLEIQDSNDNIYLRLSVEDKDNRIPSREVITTLHYIGDNRMVFMMKHIYERPLSDQFYQYVTFFKKKLFKKFQRVMTESRVN